MPSTRHCDRHGRTAADAEIIGIIDPTMSCNDWLRIWWAAFADPRVGLVQAPQDPPRRQPSRCPTHNGEYVRLLLRLGMVHAMRHAIIVHAPCV